MLESYKPMLRTTGTLVGRFLLALLFVSSGVNMLLGGIGNTAMYFDSVGVPMASIMAVVVIALKIGAGGALMLGYKAEEAAAALFIFTALTIYIAHMDPQDMNLWKNLSIMGGLLYVMAYGPGEGWTMGGKKAAMPSQNGMM